VSLRRRLQSMVILHCQKEISWREKLESLSQEFRCIYHFHLRKQLDLVFFRVLFCLFVFFFWPAWAVKKSIQFSHSKQFLFHLEPRGRASSYGIFFSNLPSGSCNFVSHVCSSRWYLLGYKYGRILVQEEINLINTNNLIPRKNVRNTSSLFILRIKGSFRCLVGHTGVLFRPTCNLSCPFHLSRLSNRYLLCS